MIGDVVVIESSLVVLALVVLAIVVLAIASRQACVPSGDRLLERSTRSRAIVGRGAGTAKCINPGGSFTHLCRKGHH